MQSHGIFTFLFILLHIPLYNVLPEAFVVAYFELWVLNLNEEEEKKLLCFVIGMAKVLPIIDGYDRQKSSFSSSDSTPITLEGSHISR